MVEWKLGKLRIRNLELFTFISLIIIYGLAIFIKPDTPIYNSIASVSTWIREYSLKSSFVLLTAFLICFFGNSTVLIVVPYALVIYYLSIYNPSSWVWIGLISGLGAGLGELVSYYIGKLIGKAKSVKKSDVGEKFYRMKVQFEKDPKLVPAFVFIFALTPLPDDIILVPLGMMNYDYKKTIIPCVIGKTILTLILCLFGSFVGSIPAFWDQLFTDYPWTRFLHFIIPSEDVNPQSDLITFSFIFIFIYLVARLDFDGFMKRLSKDRKKFQNLLMDGGEFKLIELEEIFKVANLDKFERFLHNLSEKHPNIKNNSEKIKFIPLEDGKIAFDQSMEFIDYFYSNEGMENV
ncbi:MAG: VTT domain-containing protein [Promethearchaeota archaeon]